MATRHLLLLLAFAGCAHFPGREPPDLPRLYELNLERSRALVIDALATRHITLNPTNDPLVMISTPRIDEIVTWEPGASGPQRRVLQTASRTWRVVFQPAGPHATGVRVSRGEQLVWADQAERSALITSASAPATTRADLPLDFKTDPEAEAAVAAALEAQPDVEVSDPEARAEFERPLLPALADPPLAESNSRSCELELGALDDGAFAPGHVVLMSDPLGAREPFDVLEGLLCHAAARRLPLTVALSIPTDEQGAINDYLSSTGDPPARAALLSTKFWNSTWQDGRSSLATFDFLERVRVRRAQGQAVTVLAVDLNQLGNIRYGRIASVLLSHHVEHPERLLLALLGNVMVSRHRGAAWDPQLLPVGARLAAVLPAQTHAFDVAFHPGAHWTCRLGAQGALDCGTWAGIPGPRQRVVATTPRPFFRRFDRVSAEGFDGVYFVGGALTPAVPAVESRRVDERRPALLSVPP